MYFLALVLTTLPAASGDWPTYRGDAARSGYTAETLPPQPKLAWTYRSAHAPEPAWPTRNRLRFDTVYQPVIANGLVYFGSSADGKVYALDSHNGRLRWEFFTDSPVRFAPAVWKDRLFMTSDDGHLYCLAADDGRLVWKRRAGPAADMLLGNDRLVSRWPARGGAVVADDTLYFAAGIWPSEGVYIYALDPQSGTVRWCNDTSGALEMDQPHQTAHARSGAASQGYLAVDGDRLLVPTGRAVPAIFDRHNGQLLTFRLQANQQAGGADVVALGDWFVNGGAVYETSSELMLGRTGVAAAMNPQYLFVSGKNASLDAIDRRSITVDKQVTDARGTKRTVKALARPAWTVELPEAAMLRPLVPRGAERPEGELMGATAWDELPIAGQPATIIVAGNWILVGGQDRVLALDINSRSPVWQAEIEGVAGGLAVAGHQLYVSTDRGVLYCFGAEADVKRPISRPTISLFSNNDKLYQDAADEIVRRCDVKEGYCVDLACGDGQLALALAQRTKLHIYGVEEDADKVDAARRLLDRAGLYGTRVTIHHAKLSDLPYPNYFADLVVSGRSVAGDATASPSKHIERIQRPYGGVACFGRPGAMRVSTRGPLAGAGNWTHQNTNAANTLCAEDSLVRAPLAMLWYRDTDFVMPLRHGRGPAPLVDSGRMFAEGVHGLRAVNLYNGRTLWEFPLENVLRTYHREHSIGAAWTGGNYCLGGDCVYVHTGDRCLAVDQASGKQVRELHPPKRPGGKPGTWGYIAYDDGLLFGTLADEDYLVHCWRPTWDTRGQFIQSALLFAVDPATGAVRWTYKPERSIRNNAIAINGGRVYVIDRDMPKADDLRFPLPDRIAEAKRRARANGTSDKDELQKLIPQPVGGRLLALDAATGRVVWETDREVFGTQLAVSEKHGLLLMCYQPVHQASLVGEVGDRMAALRTQDGSRVWDVAARYVARPILNDRTIYAEPGAWNLLTGEKLPFSLQRSYGCGIPAGSCNLLVFRSATLAYIDLTRGAQTENYGGIRPGCWVNAIPAGGLVLMADAASWCTCSYLNQATIALEPARSQLP